MQLGKLNIKNSFISGPMAALSNFPLREVIAGFGGVALQYTEMLDCKRLLKEDFNNNPYILKNTLGVPTIHQIFTSDSVIAVKAVSKLMDYGVDGIDVNMACPAPNIKKQQSGIMLMNDEELASRIVAEIRRIYNGTLTVKIRIGFEDDIGKTIGFCKKLEKEGADAIVFHPRLFNQKLKALSKWKYITDLKNNIKIPVIGNGDVKNAKDALERQKEYNIDWIMISRLSAVRPWIFREIECLEKNETFILTKDELSDMWEKYFELSAKYFDEHKGFERIVKWVEYFSKNFMFGHQFWVNIKNAKTVSKAKEIGMNFIGNNSLCSLILFSILSRCVYKSFFIYTLSQQ
ncbi:MAG: tRNA-dihydrouridine synthase B [uncultured bacterium]|nr:MAG: tRNA-dihydrouridine synthase B [uncultured bacterium]